MSNEKKHIPRRTVDERLAHIAFIMDGNGRWAKKRGMVREFGHRAGAETFRRVSTYCRDIGIKAVTVYVLSTENITKRPEREVSALMDLLRRYLDEAQKDAHKNKIAFRFPGDRSALPRDIAEMMDRVEKESEVYSSMHILNMCINYGGRADILGAVNRLIASGEKCITEEMLTNALTTLPTPPDLIVRTGGDVRVSNFLLWDCAYSEFYFTDILWPDLDEKAIDDAIEDFYSRQRRYGSAPAEGVNG